MIKPINSATGVKNRVMHIIAPYSGTQVKAGTEYVDHSLLTGEKADMRMHMQKLEEFLKNNPGDIEIRTQLATLRELLSH